MSSQMENRSRGTRNCLGTTVMTRGSAPINFLRGQIEVAHQQCKKRNKKRGLSNTEASIPTVSLVKLFLPSVSVGTDGEMNTRSVNVQNPFVNEVVGIIARA